MSSAPHARDLTLLQPHHVLYKNLELASFRHSPLFSTQLGVLKPGKTMQRLTARFLLLFALAGTFVPAALQAIAAPPHACCRRNAAHHCTDSKTSSDEPVIRGIGCCHHDCCRAIATSQWAHPQPPQAVATTQNSAAREIDSQSMAFASSFFSSQSSRAPPAC